MKRHNYPDKIIEMEIKKPFELNFWKELIFKK